MNSLVVLCTEGDWESDREEQDKLHNVFFDYRKAFYSILGAKLGRHGQGPSNTGYVEIGSLDGDQQGLFAPQKRYLWRDLIPVCKN